MSGTGRPESTVPDAGGLTIGIVRTAWNAELTEQLRRRALTVAEAANATVVEVQVAGAVELPVVAQQLARQTDAVVALGVVIRGETPHFDYVCDSVTDGLTRIALDESVPVAHGVLTVNSYEQAVARDGHPGSAEDKGGEAVSAALGAALELRRLRELSR